VVDCVAAIPGEVFLGDDPGDGGAAAAPVSTGLFWQRLPTISAGMYTV